jgi:hypothetical protein
MSPITLARIRAAAAVKAAVASAGISGPKNRRSTEKFVDTVAVAVTAKIPLATLTD